MFSIMDKDTPRSILNVPVKVSDDGGVVVVLADPATSDDGSAIAVLTDDPATFERPGRPCVVMGHDAGWGEDAARDDGGGWYGNVVSLGKGWKIAALQTRFGSEHDADGSIPNSSIGGSELETSSSSIERRHTSSSKGSGVTGGRAPPPPSYMLFFCASDDDATDFGEEFSADRLFTDIEQRDLHYDADGTDCSMDGSDVGTSSSSTGKRTSTAKGGAIIGCGAPSPPPRALFRACRRATVASATTAATAAPAMAETSPLWGTDVVLHDDSDNCGAQRQHGRAEVPRGIASAAAG